MVEDLTRARNRLTKFLLRHSVVWRDGSNWTFKHQRWLAGLRFDDRALAATFARLPCHGRVTRHQPRRRRSRPRALLRPCTLRRTGPSPGRLPGCDPHGRSVHGRRRCSTGDGSPRRGHSCRSPVWSPRRTRPGSANIAARSPTSATVTSAPNWSKRPGPTNTDPTSVWASAARHDGLSPEVTARAWAAEVRCHHDSANSPPARTSARVVAAAIARELAGFLWAEMTADSIAASSP